MWLTEVRLAKWRQGLVLKPGSAVNFGFKVGSAHGVVCECVRVCERVRARVCMIKSAIMRPEERDGKANTAAIGPGGRTEWGAGPKPGRMGQLMRRWWAEKSQSLPDRIWHLLTENRFHYNPAKRIHLAGYGGVAGGGVGGGGLKGV